MEIESLFSSTRWEIIKALARDKLSPMELAVKTKTTSANISQQLRLLELAGLVRSEKTSNVERGKPRVVYMLAGDMAFLILSSPNFASKKPYPVLKGKEELTKSQQVRKAEKAMDEYENMLISLENTDNMLLSFAHIVRYMKVEFVRDQDLLDRVDNINSSLPTPIDEVKKYKYLIEPFKDL